MAALMTVLFRPIKLKKRYFLGKRKKEITSIIAHALQVDRFHGTMFFGLCYYFAFKRLAKTLAKRSASFTPGITQVFFPWENQPWHKLLALAFRQHAPSIKLVGFQNASIPPQYINHFPTKRERNYLPYPHEIKTTGENSQKTFGRPGAFSRGSTRFGMCAKARLSFFRGEISSRQEKAGCHDYRSGHSDSC